MSEIASLTLSPTHTNIVLTPGTPFSGRFTVSNRGDVAYPLKLRTAPFCITGSGADYTQEFAAACDADSHRTQLMNWIDLDATTFTHCNNAEWTDFTDDGSPILSPSSCLAINYTINPPASIPDGGQFAAIILSFDASAGNVAINQEVPFRFFARASNGQNLEQGEVIRTHIPALQFRTPLSARITVKNTGNVDFLIRRTLTVTNWFDRVFYEHTEDALIFPDRTRDLQLEWPDSPGFGLYRVNVTTELCSSIDSQPHECVEIGTKSEATHTVVMLPLPVAITLMAGIILLATFIIWKARRNKAIREF
ncbi:hypothetical protein FWH13_00350 [Candidatus Saccharibacteria bacterium]|nr:hypothetical protein [Candidatus Saccharibacteria bacterium]